MAEPLAGLRDRKKLRTRQEISDVATRLFMREGFEEVTLAQIAEAADVSVKTIFNYFGSKEELYFDRAGEAREALVATVREREPGVTALEALHALFRDNVVPFRGNGWEPLYSQPGLQGLRAFFATEDRSPALRARRLLIVEAFGQALQEVLAEDLGRDPAEPALRCLGAALVATMNVRDRVLRTALAEEVPAAELQERVVAVVDEAFGRLRAAYADVDRPKD